MNDCTLFFSCAHIYVPIVFPASLSDILFEYFSLRLCFQQKFVKKNVKFQFLLIQDPLLFKQSYNIVNFRSSSLVKKGHIVYQFLQNLSLKERLPLGSLEIQLDS